jgi:ABC-type dipeptide/oligopeptide/nickel transport system permease subunit
MAGIVTAPPRNVLAAGTDLAQAPASPWRLAWRRFRSNGLALASLIVMVLLIAAAIAGPTLVGSDPNRLDYAAINAKPSPAHPLGTDQLGRDTLARLVFGLRISLMVAAYVAILDLLIGVPAGLAAGYFGGRIDVIVTRVADVLFAFPGLLLAILVAAVFGPAMTDRFGGIGRLLLVAGALSLVSWPLMARLVRSQTLSIREREFVTAANALGASDRRIVVRHVLPQLIGLIVTTSTLGIASVIVNEAVLSLLGLGIQPPDPSIGKMITDAIPYLETNGLQVLLPSALLVTIVLAVSFIGDGLRDAFDPASLR